MKCTHEKSENSHNCTAPSVGWLTPCLGCPTPVEAQKFIDESPRVLRKVPLYKGQRLFNSFKEIEEFRYGITHSASIN